MALPVFFDRVQETTTSTGTGTITLGGAVSGYQAFSTVIAVSGLVYYTIYDNASSWETGQGTYTNSGTTLSRTSVLASSNSGSAVNFSSGTKNVWIAQLASLMKPSGYIGTVSSSVDFGSSPITSKTFTITDSNIVSGHNVMMTMLGSAGSGKSQDENEFDYIDFSCVAGTGSFTAYGFSQNGPVIGVFNVAYIYS